MFISKPMCVPNIWFLLSGFTCHMYTVHVSFCNKITYLIFTVYFTLRGSWFRHNWFTYGLRKRKNYIPNITIKMHRYTCTCTCKQQRICALRHSLSVLASSYILAVKRSAHSCSTKETHQKISGLKVRGKSGLPTFFLSGYKYMYVQEHTSAVILLS